MSAKSISRVRRAISRVKRGELTGFIGMHQRYMLHPVPPLITDPAACVELSAAALRRNLAAHAEYDKRITIGGTREEMEERLERLLRMREEDMWVREMVWRTAEKVGVQVKEESSMEVF